MKKASDIPMFDALAYKRIRMEYKCPVHGAVMAEALVDVTGEKYIDCPLCEAEKEFEERQRLEIFQREKRESGFRDMNIEPEFFDKAFDDYEPTTDSQAEALAAVRKLVESRTGKVILLGSNGVGKSMLGAIAVKELGGFIYSMYEISTMIRQSYTSQAVRSELDIVRELASVPMLVIDELGRTKGSDAEMNWLSYILDKRHTRGLPFMLLSNAHLRRDCKDKGCPKCFENYIDNDVISRLRQGSIIINITGPDYRCK